MDKSLKQVESRSSEVSDALDEEILAARRERQQYEVIAGITPKKSMDLDNLGIPLLFHDHDEKPSASAHNPLMDGWGRESFSNGIPQSFRPTIDVDLSPEPYTDLSDYDRRIYEFHRNDNGSEVRGDEKLDEAVGYSMLDGGRDAAR